MFSKGMTQATTIVLGVILARLISKQTLGTYRQVLLAYNFIAGVLSLQLSSSLYYFIPKLGIEQRRRLVLQTSLFTLLLAAVTSAIMFFGAARIAGIFHNSDLAPLIRIFCLYPFVARLLMLVPAFMISIDRPFRAGLYTTASSFSRVAVVVTLFAMGFELPAVMRSVIAVAAVVALIGCLEMLRFSPIGTWRISWNLIVEQFYYSWPLLAAVVVGTIGLQFDKLLISSFFTSAEYAVYSCGAIKLPVIALITSSLGVAMLPDLVRKVKKGNVIDALNMWQEGARKCSLVIFPCFVFFLIVGYDLIVLLYGKDYSLASWPFRIYLFSLPIRIALYGAMFRATGQTKPIVVASILSLIINASLSLALVILGKHTIISFVGPAVGTTFAVYGSLPYLLWRLSRITSTPLSRIMRWKELSLIMLVCLASGAVLFVLPLQILPLAVKITCQAVLYLITFTALMLATKMLKEDEKRILYWPVTRARRLWACFKTRI
jgi:O-antigen/teichoic acid export membrane protein